MKEPIVGAVQNRILDVDNFEYSLKVAVDAIPLQHRRGVIGNLISVLAEYLDISVEILRSSFQRWLIDYKKNRSKHGVKFFVNPNDIEWELQMELKEDPFHQYPCVYFMANGTDLVLILSINPNDRFPVWHGINKKGPHSLADLIVVNKKAQIDDALLYGDE